MGRPCTMVLVLLAVVSNLQGAPDNRGKEFVIGFTANYALYSMPELYITTSRTTTVNVHVSAPRYTSVGLDKRFTVTAGQVYMIQVSNAIRAAGTELSTKGILVEADDEVVIYGTNMETYSNDAYLGFPTDVLGKEYYVVSHYPSSLECEFMVIGVEDNTNVRIVLGSHTSIEVYYGGRYYYRNQVMTVRLNRLDTFQVQTYGDLTGSFISSDKVVTVFSGNRRTSVAPGTTMDTLVDQMLPVDTWGKKFGIVPTPMRTTGDNIRVVASESGTKVSIQCSGGWSSAFSLGAGEYSLQVTPSNQVCYLESSKAVMVVLIVISQVLSTEPADPAMIVIPPIEQYAADYTFTTPRYSYGEYYNYVMFIVKEAEKGGLKVDGNVLPAGTVYTKIPNTNYVGGYMYVDPGTHSVRHDSPISVFGCFMYGSNTYESYGAPLGLRMAPINRACVVTTTVVGDGLDNDCDGLIDEEICTTENQRKDDDGDGKVEEDCATPPPIDGEWAIWTDWNTCSQTCSSSSTVSGTKTRTRTCTDPEPKYDGKQCVGSAAETVSCTSTTPCPIHGAWGTWGSWGSCSVTCASGTKTRTRSCNNPAPQYNGNDCAGVSSESTVCLTYVNCPVNGGFTQWTTWGSCSVTCGGGSTLRTRSCTNPAPAYGGASCTGATSESQGCNNFNCPIDGGYTAWSAWTACPVTCGSGKLYRQRSCTNPVPQYDGANCTGNPDESMACVLGNCPIDGEYTDWSQWTTCTVTCGGGTSTRDRTCTDPAPAHGGRDCIGVPDESRSCNTHNCPIDGGFGAWTSWTACGITCGYATQYRSRQCDSPTPQYNGANCTGAFDETQQCYGGIMCPIDGAFTDWSVWTACTVTCAGGTKDRSRTCTNPAPQYNGADCVGDTAETTDCNTHHCPIDGGWTEWADWSDCSSSCGPGLLTRDRTCTNPLPQYNGVGCFGSVQESEPCNGTCTVHGNWGEWGNWTTCTATCGGGRQGRVRLCDNPAPTPDGSPCFGGGFQIGSCNDQSCFGSGSGSSGSGSGSSGSGSGSSGSGSGSSGSGSGSSGSGSGSSGSGSGSSGSGSGSSGSGKMEAQYVNKCPNGFFTCKGGRVTCISEEFQCDCFSDCDDGSDESTSWASCPAELVKQCGNTASGLRVTALSVVLALVVAWQWRRA